MENSRIYGIILISCFLIEGVKIWEPLFRVNRIFHSKIISRFSRLILIFHSTFFDKMRHAPAQRDKHNKTICMF